MDKLLTKGESNLMESMCEGRNTWNDGKTMEWAAKNISTRTMFPFLRAGLMVDSAVALVDPMMFMVNMVVTDWCRLGWSFEDARCPFRCIVRLAWHVVIRSRTIREAYAQIELNVSYMQKVIDIQWLIATEAKLKDKSIRASCFTSCRDAGWHNFLNSRFSFRLFIWLLSR